MPNLPDHGDPDQEEGGGWIRGTYARDRNIYARRSDGTDRMLLAWMPRLGKFRATKDGKDYYKHNRQQFIVNVPVIAYTPGNDGVFVMCTVGHIVGGDPVTMMIPIDDATTMVPDLEQNLEDTKRALLQHMEAVLRSKQTIPTENGPKHVVHMESDLMWSGTKTPR